MRGRFKERNREAKLVSRNYERILNKDLNEFDFFEEKKNETGRYSYEKRLFLGGGEIFDEDTRHSLVENFKVGQ